MVVVKNVVLASSPFHPAPCGISVFHVAKVVLLAKSASLAGTNASSASHLTTLVLTGGISECRHLMSFRLAIAGLGLTYRSAPEP